MKRPSDVEIRELLPSSFLHAFGKLNPLAQFRNPVMFIAYLCMLYVVGLSLYHWFHGQFSWFELQISLWLFLTILFANFGLALAESRGKVQAMNLRQAQIGAFARLIRGEQEIQIPSVELKKGDIVLSKEGDIIPADGEVIKGIATVDESAITGESAPVIRESNSDRSAVTAGTKVISDQILIRITSEPGDSFLDRMIDLIENAKKLKTPSEISLSILLSTFAIMFLLVVISLKLLAEYSHESSNNILSAIVLAALFFSFLPTPISALLRAIGISGMDRLVRRNVLPKSSRAIEAAGDIDTLLIDKTGTITLGNRSAVAFIAAPGFGERQLAEVALFASLKDGTPEGRSIVLLAKNRFSLNPENIDLSHASFIAFSPTSRMSGVDITDASGQALHMIRKGAVDAIGAFVHKLEGSIPAEFEMAIETIAKKGGTPLLVCMDNKIVGVIHLRDAIKGGIRRRFTKLSKMGIRTIMVTGDNPLTASAIAAEIGCDDFIAEATPEIKLRRIRDEQQGGRLVAMAGDGTGDAPALAQADVGVAMSSGTLASREAGNFVDLDSNPSKLIDIVEIGKQLLMTRGSLTTYSLVSNISKYFATIPAVFSTIYAEGALGPLSSLNILHLHSPQSALLSVVIFNALSIFVLIPIALRGITITAQTTSKLLRNNLFLFGLGGLVVPFIVLKGIDMFIVFFGWVG